MATIFLLNEENLESVETSAIEFRTALFENEDIKTFKPDYTLGNIFPNILAQLVYYADSQLNVRVRFIPANVLGNSARLYDPHKGEILINQKETNIGRQFHLLVELALITNRKLFDEIAESLKVSDLQKIAALRITLAGYFARAVLMPKTPFSSKQKNSDKRGSKRSTDIAFYFSAGFAALGNASGQLM